ncbi:MAG: DUF2017 family protein [Actinomycetota bacterium]|nr:DUF2017 family protein [Actinomycetota bacterium]
MSPAGDDGGAPQDPPRGRRPRRGEPRHREPQWGGTFRSLRSALSRRPVRRVGDRYRIELSGPEQALLVGLCHQVTELVATGDPAVRRLFPTAFPDDPERQREYAGLTRDFLEEHHRRSLATLATTTGKREVDGDEMAAWLSAINDIRLVLGTHLDVTDGPGAGTRRASDDPQAPLDAAYNYLGWLQAHVIDAVAADLPDAGLPGADDAAPS